MRILRLSTAVWALCFITAAVAQGEPRAPSNEISDVLSGITKELTTYVAALAGASGLALALLEAFKKLFSIRGRFHRAAVIRWLSEDEESIPDVLKSATRGPLAAISNIVSLGRPAHYAVRPQHPASSGEGTGPGPALASGKVYDPARAYAEFFHLTSGQRLIEKLTPRGDWVEWRGLDRAVFELEIARLMSQIQDAADSVLNNPERYPHLYAFFTRGSNGEDAIAWRNYVRDLAQASGSPATKSSSDLYGRIRLLMRRQLDAFQGVTANRWDEQNQLWAVLVGGVILLIAQIIMLAHQGRHASAPLMPWSDLKAGLGALGGNIELWAGVVLKAALGGALAPVAKDLLSSLSSLKFSK